VERLEDRRLLSIDGAQSIVADPLPGVSTSPTTTIAAPAAFQVGSWTPLTNLAPASIGTMLLLSDGTVMAQAGGTSRVWYRLTPDASGSYVNGTWSTLAPMGLERLYFTSDVLTDGRVLVVGGEYSGSTGAQNLTNTGEIYNPVTNVWTPIPNFPQSSFGDDPSEMLPDGRVLTGYIFGPQTYIYNPTTNSWSTGATKLSNDRSDEETFVKLPDDSILCYNVFGNAQHAQRFDPVLNKWVDSGAVPVQLQTTASELGSASLLPDGRVFFIGATNHTAIYTPSTTRTGTVSWVAGPDIPGGLGGNDAPGCMMPNGDVLFVAGGTPQLSNAPSSIFEYDPVANTINPVTVSGPNLNTSTFTTRMLMLPSGQVLYSSGSGARLYAYNPVGSPSSSWAPAITNIANNGSGNYTLTGTQLNGISEGASYGDDAQMSSNYPIVRLTNQLNGAVSFARTFNWSSTGVATGATPVSVQFTLPAGLSSGNYQVSVVANGIASASVSLTVDPTISGKVFFDTNLNGTLDAGESGRVGWTLFDDLNNDGVFEPGEPSTVTGAGGSYQFNNVGLGDHHIRELVQSGYVETGPSSGVFDVNVPSSPDNITDLNFGNVFSTVPFVASINRAIPTTATAGGPSVTYIVTFNEPVTGVDEANPSHDFALVTTGSLAGASISSITGSGAVYTVTVSGITGNGTLGLNLVDDGTIRDASGHRLFQPDGPASFASQTTFAAGSNPISVAMGDFNGDGALDLAVANSSDNNVGIMLNNGDGTFAAQTTYSTGGVTPRWVTVADVNHDNQPDLLITNFGSNTVSVLLGNSNGTFGLPTTFATGVQPVCVTVQDINHDNNPDLVITNSGSNTVSVLLGNGAGMFGPQTTFATGAAPVSVVVADVNNDNNPDLIVANNGSANVSVLLGDGTGAFGAQTIFATGRAAASVAVADFNNDGKPDIAVTNTVDQNISILLGNGAGAFGIQTTYAAGSGPLQLAAVDVNGDGLLDLVAANSGGGSISVLLSRGDGTFEPQTTFAVGASPFAVAVTDVNGDGKPDLVSANFNGNNVSVLSGNSNGNFMGQVYTIVNPPTIALTVGGEAPNFTTSWYNSGPVPIENNVLASIGTLSGIPSLQSLTVTLATFHTGDVLSLAPLGGVSLALTSSYSAGTLTLSGTDTVAHYQQALRFINYNNTVGGPGATPITATFVANDGTYSSNPVTSTININVGSGEVLGNRLFYNNSKYDLNNGAIDANDDLAIASDKTGYTGTGTATFANISAFNKGITGIMVDLASGLGTHSAINLTSGDITFKVSPAAFVTTTFNQLSTWSAAPSPSAISVRMGAGQGGSDRLEITFGTSVIRNQWIEVDVHADGNTGLSADDVFFFGSVVGDSGAADTVLLAKTDGNDYNVPFNNIVGLTTPVWNLADYTKDGKVDGNDATTAISNVFTLHYLANPTGPFAPNGSGSAAPAASPAATPAAVVLPTASTSAASAVSSALSVLNNHSSNTPSVPSALTQVLSSPPATQSRRGDLTDPQRLLAVDQIADSIHSDRESLDELWAELGLGPSEIP
jgi:hypothetical protein